MLLLKRTALVASSYRFLMTRTRLALMLYFFVVAHIAVVIALAEKDATSQQTHLRLVLLDECPFLTLIEPCRLSQVLPEDFTW